jgi:hypothetical protein
MINKSVAVSDRRLTHLISLRLYRSTPIVTCQNFALSNPNFDALYRVVNPNSEC